MGDDISIRDATGATVAVSTEEVTTLNGAGSQPAQHVQRMLLSIVSGTAATDLPADGTNGLSVRVTNASIPVTDGGGSLTVDGTVAVTDGGGSITVDGSVGVSSALSSPVGVRLSDGTSALATTSSELHVRDATARSALAAIQTAVELIDNIVSGAGINQTQVAGTAVAVNTGNASAGTQRVVLATDQPAVAVSGTVALVLDRQRSADSTSAPRSRPAPTTSVMSTLSAASSRTTASTPATRSRPAGGTHSASGGGRAGRPGRRDPRQVRPPARGHSPARPARRQNRELHDHDRRGHHLGAWRRASDRGD